MAVDRNLNVKPGKTEVERLKGRYWEGKDGREERKKRSKEASKKDRKKGRKEEGKQ